MLVTIQALLGFTIVEHFTKVLFFLIISFYVLLHLFSLPLLPPVNFPPFIILHQFSSFNTLTASPFQIPIMPIFAQMSDKELGLQSAKQIRSLDTCFKPGPFFTELRQVIDEECFSSPLSAINADSCWCSMVRYKLTLVTSVSTS